MIVELDGSLRNKYLVNVGFLKLICLWFYKILVLKCIVVYPELKNLSM